MFFLLFFIENYIFSNTLNGSSIYHTTLLVIRILQNKFSDLPIFKNKENNTKRDFVERDIKYKF